MRLATLHGMALARPEEPVRETSCGYQQTQVPGSVAGSVSHSALGHRLFYAKPILNIDNSW